MSNFPLTVDELFNLRQEPNVEAEALKKAYDNMLEFIDSAVRDCESRSTMLNEDDHV